MRPRHCSAVRRTSRCAPPFACEPSSASPPTRHGPTRDHSSGPRAGHACWVGAAAERQGLAGRSRQSVLHRSCGSCRAGPRGMGFTGFGGALHRHSTGSEPKEPQEGRRSRLSHPPICDRFSRSGSEFSGPLTIYGLPLATCGRPASSSGGGTRTHNLAVNSRSLCLIELPPTACEDVAMPRPHRHSSAISVAA
jgi:hypothetical protein